MSKQLALSVGALAPTIAEQAKAQGLVVEHADAYQKDIEAANRLRIRGYLPDAVSRKTVQKIVDEIGKHTSEAQ